MRMGFPLWYSNDERVLRYFAVKRNDFVREPRIPEHLLTRRDRLDAYLLENTLPGDAKGALKPLERLIVHEGALSAFFLGWATNDALRQIRRNAAFYESFGTTAEAVTPLQNMYLKLFHVLDVRKPRDASALAAAYRRLFPDEAIALDAVVAEVFHARTLDVPPEIWVVNADFRTGTTIFDQFRGAPRAHTFDLNAASVVDLTTVPGVTPALARKIASSGPYASIEALARVPGVSPDLLERFKTMAKGMDALRAADEETLSMQQILLPFLWRGGIALLLAWAACGLVYGMVRSRVTQRPSVGRIIASGFGAALVGVTASWISGNTIVPLLAVIVLFGLPAAAWQVYRHRNHRLAAAAIAVWAATVVPAILVTTPWVR
jgi:DNA uptake protein ComE-like DNA-binding protein